MSPTGSRVGWTIPHAGRDTPLPPPLRRRSSAALFMQPPLSPASSRVKWYKAASTGYIAMMIEDNLLRIEAAMVVEAARRMQQARNYY